LKNLYGLKDAGRTWFEFLEKGLHKRGWKSFSIDGCLFTKNGIMLVVYVDDAILISPHKSLIHKEIKSFQP
jgi:GH43 family beta-xylosidase